MTLSFGLVACHSPSPCGFVPQDDRNFLSPAPARVIIAHQHPRIAEECLIADRRLDLVEIG